MSLHFMDLPRVKVVLPQEGTPSCHCQVFVGGVPQDLNQDDLYVLWQILCAQIVADGDIDGEDLLLLCASWCELKNKVRIRNSVCQSGFFQWTSWTKNVRPSRCFVFKFGSGLHRCISIIGSMMLTLQWFWPLTTSNLLDGDVIRNTQRWSLVYSMRFDTIDFAEGTVHSTTYIIYIYGWYIIFTLYTYNTFIYAFRESLKTLYLSIKYGK